MVYIDTFAIRSPNSIVNPVSFNYFRLVLDS
jgi:hypothetical protein